MTSTASVPADNAAITSAYNLVTDEDFSPESIQAALEELATAARATVAAEQDGVDTESPSQSGPHSLLSDDDYANLAAIYADTLEQFEKIVAEDDRILSLAKVWGWSETEVRERIGDVADRLGFDLS